MEKEVEMARPSAVTAVAYIFIATTIITLFVMLLLVSAYGKISSEFYIWVVILVIINVILSYGLFKIKKWAWYLGLILSILWFTAGTGIVTFILLMLKKSRIAFGIGNASLVKNKKPLENSK